MRLSNLRFFDGLIKPDNYDELRSGQAEALNPEARHDAENATASLGTPSSAAIDIELRQAALTRGIPFPLSVPQVPARLDLDKMSDGELAKVLRRGLAEAESGLSRSVSDVRASLL